MANSSTQATSSPTVNWQSLTQAVRNQECILVLGPGVSTLERDGLRVPLQTLLAQHLADELRRIQPKEDLVNPDNLPYVAKKLEDAVFKANRNYSPENARRDVADIIKAFYEQFSSSDFPVYSQLAKMPFHFVVETNPAPYLAQAYDDENKFDARCLYYDYAFAGHNNKAPTISRKNPSARMPRWCATCSAPRSSRNR